MTAAEFLAWDAQALLRHEFARGAFDLNSDLQPGAVSTPRAAAARQSPQPYTRSCSRQA